MNVFTAKLRKAIFKMPTATLVNIQTVVKIRAAEIPAHITATEIEWYAYSPNDAM